MEHWVKRVGDRVFLVGEHVDDGLYELLRRIEALENEVEMQQTMYRNLERKYELAKQWNKCSEEDINNALLRK